MRFTWDIDPVIFQITATYGIRYYGLFFSFLFFGGFLLFRWQVKRGGGSEDEAVSILVPGALGTVIGARLGHCLFYNFDRVLSDPLWLFRIWEGGLSSHGAVVGLLAAIWVYARMHRQSYVECLDRFSYSAALATVLVRLGNFFNSEIVGRLTGGDWGVRFPRYDNLPAKLAPLRHPSQLYEAAFGLMLMVFLFILDRRLGGEKRPRGVLAAAGLTFYFTGRFLIEFVKEYQVLPPDFPLTMGQILSIPAVAIGAVWLRFSLTRRVPAQWMVRDQEPARPAGRPKQKIQKSSGQSSRRQRKKR